MSDQPVVVCRLPASASVCLFVGLSVRLAVCLNVGLSPVASGGFRQSVRGPHHVADPYIRAARGQFNMLPSRLSHVYFFAGGTNVYSQTGHGPDFPTGSATVRALIRRVFVRVI